jgi:hypothetical protein
VAFSSIPQATEHVASAILVSYLIMNFGAPTLRAGVTRVVV